VVGIDFYIRGKKRPLVIRDGWVEGYLAGCRSWVDTLIIELCDVDDCN